MVEQYRTIYMGGSGEFTEKKSRFIGHAAHVESEEEALAFIEKIRKQHWDANHNCWAYVIGTGSQMARCSDDGEPGGTAGRPMLDVLTGQGVCNTAAVVTRYFGGTLLGTGGLVRAYTKGVQCTLESSVLVEKYLARKLEIRVDYTELGKVQYLLAQENIKILDSVYEADVRLCAPVPVRQLMQLKEKLTDGTGGKICLNQLEQIYYGIVDGEMKIWSE